MGVYVAGPSKTVKISPLNLKNLKGFRKHNLSFIDTILLSLVHQRYEFSFLPPIYVLFSCFSTLLQMSVISNHVNNELPPLFCNYMFSSSVYKYVCRWDVL